MQEALKPWVYPEFRSWGRVTRIQGVCGWMPVCVERGLGAWCNNFYWEGGGGINPCLVHSWTPFHLWNHRLDGNTPPSSNLQASLPKSMRKLLGTRKFHCQHQPWKTCQNLSNSRWEQTSLKCSSVCAHAFICCQHFHYMARVISL